MILSNEQREAVRAQDLWVIPDIYPSEDGFEEGSIMVAHEIKPEDRFKAIKTWILLPDGTATTIS